MLTKIKNYFLTLLYRALIQRTIVLDKSNVSKYEKLNTFCTMGVQTDRGEFTFYFKEDRRKSRRASDRPPYITNYVIELGIPDGLVGTDKTIDNKVVIVVKVILFKINYEVLTKLLTDIYLDNILSHIEMGQQCKI